MPGVTTAYQSGVHGSRPAASAGCILYACSTHSLIYRSDGSSWTTWMTIGSSTTTVATDAIWDAKGDLAAGTGADTAAKLSVGADDTILMADAAQSTGLKWVASATPVAIGTSLAAGTSDDFARGSHVHTAAGRLIGVQRITATGAYTYTPTSGTASVVIELQGAGGGGSAVAAGSASQTRVGVGGAGGGYLLKRLTGNFSGGTGSIGSKGTGGASGGDNNGTAGGDTTFVDTAGSPTTYTATGGEATRTGPVSSTNVSISAQNYGGVATNGDINVPGGNSGIGIGTAAATIKAHGGDGGSSRFGTGGAGATTTTTAAGVAATGKGGGGGGAANTGTGASAAGGDGTDGIAIFWEYS